MTADINKAVERLSEQFAFEVEAILKAWFPGADRKTAVVTITNLFSREVATLSRERDEAREALRPFAAAFCTLDEDDRVRRAWNVTVRVSSDALRTANAIINRTVRQSKEGGS